MCARARTYSESHERLLVIVAVMGVRVCKLVALERGAQRDCADL